MRSCQVSSWDGMGVRSYPRSRPRKGGTLGRQDLCSFPGQPLTLCVMSPFRESSCRDLCLWPHNGLRELGARPPASLGRGTVTGFTWIILMLVQYSLFFPFSLYGCPKVTAASHISSVQASLLAGFHPGFACSLPRRHRS